MTTRAHSNRLKAAIAIALATAAMAPLAAVFAQDASVPAALEEVVVTGSRIRGSAPVGSSVIGLDRNDIVDAGAVTVDRIIKELPAISSLGVSEASRGQAGGSGNITWGNAINIHGIGPFATLVILDGHRTISNSRAIDPSIVPSLGLERIEVVADGASAVYGSDAVAGVVNLIPRRTLNGVETSGRYGKGDHFDESQVGIAAGKVWDGGQIMVAFEHVYRSSLNGDDRAFYTNDQRNSGGGDYRVTRCSPGTLHGSATGAAPLSLNFAIPQGGVTAATAAALVAGTTNRCDDLPGQDILPEQKYNTGNFTYTQSFTDHIELFADGFFSKRDFRRLPAYFSVSGQAIPITNAFFVQPPGTTGATTIDYSFRELPRDVQTGSSENWEVTPGLRFKLPHDFQIEVLYTYGKNDDEANTFNGLNLAALGVALASSNPATAFDPYGLGRTTASTLASLTTNQIFLAPTINTFKGYEARVNGPLFPLPGGSVRVAAGYERQEMHVSLGLARPILPINYREFPRTVDSGYLELLVPVFGTSNAISGISRLEFTSAVRYDKYSDVGNTTNPKFGLNYAPIESLTFRGSYGTSFRAPLISEIYGNSNNLFGQSYQNPAGGAPLTGFAQSGGNLNLKPEEATTWSFGADFKPTSSTTLNLTYWSVNYKKQVANYLSNLALLTIEPQFAGTGIILHGAEAGARIQALVDSGVTLARGSFPGGLPSAATLYIDGRNNNLGVSNTRGIDFQAIQHLRTDAAGAFTFSLGGTYITKYEVAITDVAPMVDKLNTIFNPMRLRARGAVTWDYSAVTTQVAVNYVNGYDNNAVTPTQSVGAYVPVDVSVRLHADSFDWLGSFGTGLTLGLEVRNAFDKDPPYVNIAQSVNGGGGFDPTVTDPVGRLYAVTLRKNW